jgi:DNA-binding NarL/FixJ family response regulator
MARFGPSPARILIVDDEPLNVDYLEQELESLGFATETAMNALDALERVATAPPDLVLLDVMMPGMDGFAALRVLKSDPETRLIPVVLMTALNSVEDRVRGIEAGADDFLTKPVDDRELLARIRTALTLRRAIEQTVDELASTSAHLERYGRQTRDVAVLAIEWRLQAPGVPEDAVGFVGRRHREAVAAQIQALGGTAAEGDDAPLLAVFEGPDDRSRATAAVEAALAIVGDSEPDAQAGLITSLAVSIGTAEVGSTRVERAGEARWVYGATGAPVERAAALARDDGAGRVLVAGAAAAAVSERFSLAPLGDGTYVVAAGGGPDPLPIRRITTILATDIVGSTRIAERVGDRAWSALVAAYERATRDEVAAYGGDEIAANGDGLVASFDTPERAIACAHALVARLDGLGMRIRAGVHTGEIEHIEGKIRGIAVNVATCMSTRATPSEVLVSATVRELAAGSGLVFADRGEDVLEGLSEPRRLYAALPAPAPVTLPEPDKLTELPAGLTARELEVLRHVAAGLSDAETAARLYLSVRTVNAHLRSIYRKLGVRSRAAAGRFAEENGLL